MLSNLKNPLTDPIRFELRPQVRKIHERPPMSLCKTLLGYVATAATAAESSIPIILTKSPGSPPRSYKKFQGRHSYNISIAISVKTVTSKIHFGIN